MIQSHIWVFLYQNYKIFLVFVISTDFKPLEFEQDLQLAVSYITYNYCDVWRLFGMEKLTRWGIVLTLLWSIIAKVWTTFFSFNNFWYSQFMAHETDLWHGSNRCYSSFSRSTRIVLNLYNTVKSYFERKQFSFFQFSASADFLVNRNRAITIWLLSCICWPKEGQYLFTKTHINQ